MVHTNATVKLAREATPTNHQIITKEGNVGMNEAEIPDKSIRKENKRMDLFLPQISDTSPATNVPTEKPEKKIIFEITGSPL